MDYATVIINLGLFCVTTIAAIIAWRSAKDAREARDEASTHATSSLAEARRSANAAVSVAVDQKRSADSLEKQVGVLEATASPPDKWLLEAMSNQMGDQKWKVTNKTGEDVTSVTIGTPDGFNEQWIAQKDETPADLARDESIFFTFIRRVSSPSSRTIWVIWTPADGSAQQKFTKTIP